MRSSLCAAGTRGLSSNHRRRDIGLLSGMQLSLMELLKVWKNALFSKLTESVKVLGILTSWSPLRALSRLNGVVSHR